MLVQNKDVRVHIIGGKALIPGGPPVELTHEEINHPILKAYFEAGQLIKVQGDTEASTEVSAAEGQSEGKSLDEMTLAELKAYAKEHDIDLGTATKKEAILGIVKANVGGNKTCLIDGEIVSQNQVAQVAKLLGGE